jgi:polyferredoxin
MSGIDLILAPIAAGTAAATAVLLKESWQAKSPRVRNGAIGGLALLLAIFSGLVLSLRASDSDPIAFVSALGGVMVGAATLPSIWAAKASAPVRENPAINRGGLRDRTAAFAIGGVALVIAFLLGWSFELISDPGAVGAGFSGVVTSVVTSGWFLGVAAGEMVLLTILLRDRLARGLRTMFLFQAAIVFLLPTTLPFADWPSVAIYGATAVIVALFIFEMQFMYRNKQLDRDVSQYMLGVAAATAFTAAGLFCWAWFGSSIVLVIASFAQLIIFFGVIGIPQSTNETERVAWPFQPFWAFQLLLCIFVAELFLGALIDVHLYGGTFIGWIPFAPLQGSVLTIVGNAVYDGLWFVAAVTVSAWFLIVMGVEMAALVVFKIRESHEREQKIRLGLMIGVYAIAVVYLPSFWSATPLFHDPALANIPIIGWGMGIRTGGPFAPTFFAAIILMYASVGVLTVLFGRRALCSVMCGAAMMYQGTTINSMKSFNSSSRVGRMFSGSQFSTAYTVASSLALISLFATSFLPYLHLLPGVEIRSTDLDANLLPFELYFGALWFVMFVSIPYIGNYNCVTTGFCHWGTFSALFNRVSFFKLKVKDKKVCQTCTTMDCAKACPVGLVDMPRYFRTRGEFKSAKCCGVGDCIGACPYNNMYLQDVRHWIRGKLGQSRELPPARDRLPMVKSSRPSPTSTISPPSSPTTASR